MPGPLSWVLRKTCLAGLIATLAFLIYWCGRLAWADVLARAGNPAAIALAPGDADIRLQLAGRSAEALAAAAALDPGNADTRLRLGLADEMLGDFPAAERRLLEAARVSRQYAPRWALANFYFRRGDRDRFWSWANAALRIGYGDLDPVFALCWSLTTDAAEIRRRAIPDRAPVLNVYVQFLLRTGRLAASEPVAARLAAVATRDDLSALSVWDNLQLDQGSPAAAVTVWNTLCHRHLLPYQPLDPDLAPLTDGDFRGASPVTGGFTWRLPRVDGAAAELDRRAACLRVEFGGNQPESCAPVLQYVPVTAGNEYWLGFEYRTTDIAPASGLAWDVLPARAGADAFASSPWLSSEDWKRGEVCFHAPASGLVRVALTYRRLLGTARIIGSVETRRMSLERRP